jgi:hypothetical protein
MAEGKSQPFSDEAIRHFLLGDLNSIDQGQIEQALFNDEALEERVRLGELELADDYAANRLSGNERDLFSRRFLLTTDRRRELEVSTALHRNFASAGFIARDSWWQPVVNVFDFRRHAWKYAVAALILMVFLLATALLVRKERSRLVDDSPRPRRAAPRPSASETPRMTNHSTNAPAPAHNETSPALPLHEGLATSIVLVSGTALDSAPTISTSGEVITVQLKLNQPPAESYDVNVMTTSGETVFSNNSLRRSEDEILVFELPTSVLKPGEFQIALTRIDGESKQSAATYYFRVR